MQKKQKIFKLDIWVKRGACKEGEKQVKAPNFSSSIKRHSLPALGQQLSRKSNPPEYDLSPPCGVCSQTVAIDPLYAPANPLLPNQKLLTFQHSRLWIETTTVQKNFL